MDALDTKLLKLFPGRIVRKDLTGMIKEGFNVPVYVLEYLLGMYCAVDDEESIIEGMDKVRKILSSNFVRPHEAEKVKSRIREKGNYRIIDKISVRLNEKKDIYEAQFSNLGIKGVPIDDEFVKKYEKLLVGGIWAIIDMEYVREDGTPFRIAALKPIQMPRMDINEILEKRKHFTKEEWMNVLLRSVGIEPSHFDKRVKWHLLMRLVPFVESNFNLCELGPRGTGKSYVYKEISPYSILVSGGHTTVANLFYNMATRKIGLVGLWDVVAFDEVAGIRFKDKDGVQIMKDYMASGSFARGKDQKQGVASLVFVGNINQSVETLLKTSHLFSPFPPEMANDSAFFDRMHYYIPGWEIPKMKPEYFTKGYGFIVDYLSEYFREMRKTSFSDSIDRFFKFGRSLNQRDVIAVRKTVSGLIKLLYPDGNFSKEDIAEILEYALEGRRRVKEQLKKIGGMEFYDVHFSYIDMENGEERFISVPEIGGGKLVPEGIDKPGNVYSVARSESGVIGVYKIEVRKMQGSGKSIKTGIGGSRLAKEALETAFLYFNANKHAISQSIDVKSSDYAINVIDLQGIGPSGEISLATLIGLFSSAVGKPLLERMVVCGTMTIGGTVKKIDNLAEYIQVAVDAGARRILIPASSASDLPSIPPELITKIQLIFYSDPVDAVFKSMGVE